MMEVTLSFHKVIAHYRERLKTETNPIAIAFLNATLDYVSQHPRLEEGLRIEEIEQEKEVISTLLSDLFPRALTLNEIKAATVPFSDFLFNKTQRLIIYYLIPMRNSFHYFQILILITLLWLVVSFLKISITHT
ncbi:hypothetical protein JCM19298_595 [Nonlabens ulvanivorans]|nr:hypothetical protein JCM19298_595 [Nonlabens ulvanivorans]